MLYIWNARQEILYCYIGSIYSVYNYSKFASRIPVAVYAFTILIFTVKAFDVFINKSIYAKMLPLGALVFLISDFVMLVQMFYNLSQAAVDFYDGLNLFLYFPAQLLIANSLSEDYL